PAQAFEHPLEDTDLPLRIFNALAEAGFRSVGEVMETFYMNPDRLTSIAGVGASGLDTIKHVVDTIEFTQAAAPAEAPAATEQAQPAAVAAEVETPALVE